jgi:RND superfamily putative drug exporter
VLLPASVKLLGDWNWYLPRWLEWLPRVGGDGDAAPPEEPPVPRTPGDAEGPRPAPVPA